MRLPREITYQVFDLIVVGTGAVINSRTRMHGFVRRMYRLSPRYHLFWAILERMLSNSANRTESIEKMVLGWHIRSRVNLESLRVIAANRGSRHSSRLGTSGVEDDG